MNAAKRNAARRGWPPHLYEPRPGYYCWRDPRTGKTLVIGRVPLARAKAEAIAANLHIEGGRPGLVEQMTKPAKTIADLLDAMPVSPKKNTAKTDRTHDKRIRAALGHVRCDDLDVRACAELLDGITAEGKARTAQAVRSRLIAACQLARQKGWMTDNPAEVTAAARVKTKRERLTLETFRTIRARADEVNGWLGRLMDLALVTGADRSTLSALQRRDVLADVLVIKRSKTADSTGLVVHIPLSLELECVGLRLRDLVRNTTGIASPYIIHHTRNHGNAPKGSQVFVDRMSHAFAEARDLAGIGGEHPPTLHEARSLSKRLYEAQGNVDTQWLLGHSDAKTARLYADPRGAEPVLVQVLPIGQRVAGK